MIQRSLIAAILTALFSGLLLVAPAQAKAPVRPQVKLQLSSAEVFMGDTVRLPGRVSGPSKGAIVQLEERFGKQWAVIDKKRLKSDRRFAFKVEVWQRLAHYRVRVLPNKKIKGAKSSIATVRGVDEEVDEPDEPTDPEEPPVDPEEPPTDPEDPPTDPEEPNEPVLEDYTLEELRYELNIILNERRAAEGLGALNMTTGLNSYAQAWSEDQVTGEFTQARTSFPGEPTGYDIEDEFVTLNLLPEDVADFLEYQSPELLYGDYAWIGIGMELRSENLGQWTIDFAVKEADEPQPPTWNEESVRQEILRQTNEYRAQNGLAPLKLMPQLNTIAQDWSRRMADTNTFEHRPNFTANYPAGWKRAGENIAAGYQPEAVVAGWINSPGHRANLLGDYTHIGIGFATNNSSSYERYYTQNFAKY